MKTAAALLISGWCSQKYPLRCVKSKLESRLWGRHESHAPLEYRELQPEAR
jgi:hypothetical protein